MAAALKFEAFGRVPLHTGDVELFNAHNFGVTFRVPGLMTIGPEFRIIESLAGDASLKANATYEMNFPVWDYSIRYPVLSGENDKPDEEKKLEEPNSNGSHDKFSWDAAANGQVAAHM